MSAQDKDVNERILVLEKRILILERRVAALGKALTQGYTVISEGEHE